MNSSSPAPTWLITGTSNGFGLALAQHVLTQNHDLISISRHPSPHELLSSIPSTSSLHHIQLDLSSKDENSIKSAISDFLTSHPSLTINVLVNNAAIAAFGPAETIPFATLERSMTVNFYSPLWLIQSVLANMRNAKDGAEKVIVNISSTQGLTCDPAETAYESSKHALEGLSGCLAAEIAPFGIRTMIVNLGSFRTSFALGDSASRSSPEPATSIAIVSTSATNSEHADTQITNPYESPTHPAKIRVDAVRKFANIPNAARGDTKKAAAILFDAVMKTEGTTVTTALQKQRDASAKDGPRDIEKGLERLILGSDAQPKIEKQVKWWTFQAATCAGVSSAVDADDVQ